MNRMGACFDRLRCEVFQNLFLSPMNTGFLGSAVATVLTVYGIETLALVTRGLVSSTKVATVLTVYGIETSLPASLLMVHHQSCNSTYRLRY